MYSMFQENTAFDQYIGDWDVTSVTRASSMFQGATAYNQPMSDWETSSIETMSSMFRDTAFNQDLSKWDTSSITSVDRMFSQATAFDQDLGWCLVEKEVTTNNFATGSGCADEAPPCGVLVSDTCSTP